jgi:hypothetical protein
VTDRYSQVLEGVASGYGKWLHKGHSSFWIAKLVGTLKKTAIQHKEKENGKYLDLADSRSGAAMKKKSHLWCDKQVELSLAVNALYVKSYATAIALKLQLVPISGLVSAPCSVASFLHSTKSSLCYP